MASSHRVVTANRLRDGVPVYFARGGGWSPVFADATVVAEADGEGLLRAAAAFALPGPVIGPYLIEAEAADGEVRPLSLRERIRAQGPTV